MGRQHQRRRVDQRAARAVLIGALALTLLLLAWRAWPATAVVIAPPSDPSPSAAEAPSQAAPPAAGAVTPTAVAAPKREDHRGELELPDGTFVPALNGAITPEPLAKYWGPWPWSPITGVEANDKGVQWYRHEDGSYSTTEVLWDEGGKRHVTLTRVAHPGPANTPATAKR